MPSKFRRIHTNKNKNTTKKIKKGGSTGTSVGGFFDLFGWGDSETVKGLKKDKEKCETTSKENIKDLEKKITEIKESIDQTKQIRTKCIADIDTAIAAQKQTEKAQKEEAKAKAAQPPPTTEAAPADAVTPLPSSAPPAPVGQNGGKLRRKQRKHTK